eukprot:5743009-Amphidinium_carterae.1
MMLTKLDTSVSQPEWLCKGCHPDPILQEALRVAFAQVKALGIPVGMHKSGDVEKCIPYIGALNLNHLTFATGLTFNAFLDPSSNPEMIEQSIIAFPRKILLDKGYREKCQQGLDIFLSWVQEMTQASTDRRIRSWSHCSDGL